MQDLNWGRRHTTVAEHTMAAMNFAPLELRAMAHELDEYLTFAKTLGVEQDKAKKILDEEIEKVGGVLSKLSPFELARKRIIENQFRSESRRT